MSLNRFMHPRNIYRTPPDFTELAIKYEEFRKHAKQDLSGKVHIDFKDPAALRVLTSTLLKKDFDLVVDIPPDRLVPTLPLRLNYLLWVEDLLGTIQRRERGPIKGIDIGTGASCVYPLIAARVNGWHTLATETDGESVKLAKKQVEKNKMKDFIKVVKVDADVVLKNVINVNSSDRYDFSMCNPPFFASETELDLASKSRSSSRPPPKNSRTGLVGEVITKGGEVSFVKKMVHESMELQGIVRIYTSMLGHKSSVCAIKAELMKAEAVHITTTEFCQGRTMRWGIAWTFCPELDLKKVQQMKKSKEKPPVTYIVPHNFEGLQYSVMGILAKVKGYLEELKIEYEQLKATKYLAALHLTAMENTWSHQRRKRREQLRAQRSQAREETEDKESAAFMSPPEDAHIKNILDENMVKRTEVIVLSENEQQSSEEEVQEDTEKNSDKSEPEKVNTVLENEEEKLKDKNEEHDVQNDNSAGEVKVEKKRKNNDSKKSHSKEADLEDDADTDVVTILEDEQFYAEFSCSEEDDIPSKSLHGGNSKKRSDNKNKINLSKRKGKTLEVNPQSRYVRKDRYEDSETKYSMHLEDESSEEEICVLENETGESNSRNWYSSFLSCDKYNLLPHTEAAKCHESSSRKAKDFEHSSKFFSTESDDVEIVDVIEPDDGFSCLREKLQEDIEVVEIIPGRSTNEGHMKTEKVRTGFDSSDECIVIEDSEESFVDVTLQGNKRKAETEWDRNIQCKLSKLDTSETVNLEQKSDIKTESQTHEGSSSCPEPGKIIASSSSVTSENYVSQLQGLENKVNITTVSQSVPALKCSLYIRQDGTDVKIELMWTEGSLGREAVNQVMLYLKNKLKNEMPATLT